MDNPFIVQHTSLSSFLADNFAQQIMFSAIAIYCFLIDRWIIAEAIIKLNVCVCVCVKNDKNRNYSGNR